MRNERKGREGDGASLRCDEVLDRVSARVVLAEGSPGDPRIERHLSSCGECREAAAFMERLARVRPVPPRGLATRVLEQLERETRTIARGGWRRASLAAAAVLLLTFGTGLLSQQMGLTVGSERATWELAFDENQLGWADEEWIVAGAPYLEGVSDETLLALLDEEGF